ncbi:MAG: fibronectin type III domain-containing protein [Pseudomonadota bacterium]
MEKHKTLFQISAIAIALLLPQIATAATINSYPPIIDPRTHVIETYDAWMARVVPLALPSYYHAAGPINPPFSGVTTDPIVAPASPSGAPALTFTRGPGVTQLGVSNIVAGSGVQFVSDLGVGNDMNWSDINITPSSPVNALGFGVSSYHDPSVPRYGDSKFIITLFDASGEYVGGGTIVAPSIDPYFPNGAQESDVMPGFTFVGITSYRPFKRVEIRESRTYPTGGVQNATIYGGLADRESFGAFYASVPMADSEAPTVPGRLFASVFSKTQINLSWRASTDNNEVTGYKVYRGGVQVGTPSDISYSDTGLTAGTEYRYTVSACDAAGNCSAQSSAVVATTKSGD